MHKLSTHNKNTNILAGKCTLSKVHVKSRHIALTQYEQKQEKLTSHLSRAYKTVSNMFSNNKKYPIHSEIIISTFGTGSSSSSTFPLITVMTATRKEIPDKYLNTAELKFGREEKNTTNQETKVKIKIQSK